MRGSPDTAGMPDVRNCRACFRFEILCRNHPLEINLEFTPDFSHSEILAARDPFFGMTFGHICSLAFLGFSSVVAFRGSNSDGGNGVCFATSGQAGEITAPEASHSYAVFLRVRPNSSSEGERCMKHTVHPIVHFLVHRRISGTVRSRKSCAWHGDKFGRGQNTGLGWSDPTFVHVSVPKVIRGVAPAQLRGDRAECFVRAVFQWRTTVMNNGDGNHTELLAVHEITRLLKVPVSCVHGHSFR